MRREALKEAFRNKTFLIGFIMVMLIFAIAIFAGVIAPHPYEEVDYEEILKAPGEDGFILGTDHLGRCLFSRIVYGSRIALKVTIVAVSIQAFIGVFVGIMAGFWGGKIDRFLCFITDLTWSMPPLIMALAIITILGPGLRNVVIAMAMVSWAQIARVVRAKTLGIKNLPFVEAGISIGESKTSLMFSYIFPNVVPSIIVLMTSSIPGTIMSTTALGFLGLGTQPPLPDWGVLISESVTYMNSAPWLSIFPGLALVYTVLAFTLLGEGLRDILDPRMKV